MVNRSGALSRALLLVPASLFLMAAKTSVATVPQTVAATDSPIQMGTPVTVTQGDVIVRGKIFDTERMTLLEPVSVEIGKFSHDIPAGTRLDPVFAPAKTRRLSGASGRLYCGENQRSRSKFAEAMIGSLFSKYETIVRFCFADSDGDKRLDHVFLAGAKDEAEQVARPIDPVPYDAKLFQTDEKDSVMELKVNRFMGKDRMELVLEIENSDGGIGFSYLLTVDGNKVKESPRAIKTNPRKSPYPATLQNVLGADIEIISVDAKGKQAQIRVNRGFKTQMFRPIFYQARTVYVYY